MDERFKELTDRLVAVGKPSFSASEFHELHDYITEMEKRAGGCADKVADDVEKWRYFSMGAIEEAFWNHDNDGQDRSEVDPVFVKKKLDWKSFKAYLEAHPTVNRPEVAKSPYYYDVTH